MRVGVEADGLLRFVLQEQVDVILQILPHVRRIHLHADAVAAQVVGRPDARQHQQMRRADGAGRENDFAATARDTRFAVLPPAHAAGALSGEFDGFGKAA